MHSIWSGGLRVTANNYHQHWLKMWSTRHYEFSWQDMAEEAVVSGDWKKKSENYEFKKCVSLDEMAETAALELNEEWVQDCYGFLSGSSGLVQGETINLDDKLKIGSRLLVMDSVRKSTNRKNKQGSFYPTSKHGVDLWALDYVDDSRYNTMELFHYEWDSHNLEEVEKRKVFIENLLETVDRNTFAKEKITKKTNRKKLNENNTEMNASGPMHTKNSGAGS